MKTTADAGSLIGDPAAPLLLLFSRGQSGLMCISGYAGGPGLRTYVFGMPEGDYDLYPIGDDGSVGAKLDTVRSSGQGVLSFLHGGDFSLVPVGASAPQPGTLGEIFAFFTEQYPGTTGGPDLTPPPPADLVPPGNLRMVPRP
jgi:hypothetical protein